jgi:hypothetical protein
LKTDLETFRIDAGSFRYSESAPILAGINQIDNRPAGQTTKIRLASPWILAIDKGCNTVTDLRNVNQNTNESRLLMVERRHCVKVKSGLS